jgi:hypothetical protein
MPVTRPTTFPDIALNDVANGLGGANNVQEPPLEFKEEGWDYGQKPEREFFNWLGRVTNNWLKYTDDQVTIQIPAVIAALDVRVDSLELATQPSHVHFRSKW